MKQWASQHKWLVRLAALMTLILVLPVLVFIALSALCALSVPDDTFESALAQMKEIACTNREGQRYTPDFTYGHLSSEVAACYDSVSQLRKSIPEKPRVEANEALDALEGYIKIAQGYCAISGSDETDTDISCNHSTSGFITKKGVAYSYVNRARWREQHGDLKGALDDYLSVLIFAAQLTRNPSIIYHLDSMTRDGAILGPLTEFLRNNGSELRETDLRKIQGALEGYVSFVESLEYEAYHQVLPFVKMSKEWPRKFSKYSKYGYVDFYSLSWYDKTLFSWLPKNFFRYAAYLRLKSYSPNGFVFETSRAMLGKNREYKESKKWLEKIGSNLLEGHAFTSLFIKICCSRLAYYFNLFNLADINYTGYVKYIQQRDSSLDHIRALATIYLYQKRTGRFPKTWEELVPQYLEAKPLDYRSRAPMLLTYLTRGKNVRPYVISRLPMKLLEHNHFISAPAGRLLELVVNINGIEFPMVYIPGGAFKMGTDAAKAREFCDRLVRSHSVTKFPAEGPEHEVYLKGYYISRFEVTRDIWAEVMGTVETIQGNPKLSVDNISYDEIRTFIRQMNKGLYFPTTGFGLPTEAQWERAARGGLESAHFPWGNDLAEHKYVKLVGSGPLAPGSFPENGFGLYDMAGNVAEICSDEYQTDSYRESMYYKPKVFRKKDKPLVVRGGSWNDDLCAMRVSARRPIDPHDGEEGVGFRLVWCLTIGIISK